MKALKNIVIGLLVLTIILPTTVFGYLYFKLNSMYVSSSTTKEITTSTDFKQVKGISNILLVGIDARNLNERSRSDSMMILTIDSVHNTLKLTSLARDTYADIPGRGQEKLTHAYAYGGIDLLLDTVEKNFELDINHYAIVNFYTFIDIINTIDGVGVDIQSSEINELNKYITECYAFDKSANKGSIEYIQTPGVHTLKGYQALAYSRIRYNDSAFGRDARQRKIIQAAADKAFSLPVTKYPPLIDSVLPYVKTDISPAKMMSLGFTAYKIGNFDIVQLEFPILKYSNGSIKGGKGWVLDWDREKCLDILHKFIYENIMYE